MATLNMNVEDLPRLREVTTRIAGTDNATRTLGGIAQVVKELRQIEVALAKAEIRLEATAEFAARQEIKARRKELQQELTDLLGEAVDVMQARLPLPAAT